MPLYCTHTHTLTLFYQSRIDNGPRMPLDVHSSLKDVRSSFKDVHSRTFIARSRAKARARARVRIRVRATARFNFRHPLRTRDYKSLTLLTARLSKEQANFYDLKNNQFHFLTKCT